MLWFTKGGISDRISFFPNQIRFLSPTIKENKSLIYLFFNDEELGRLNEFALYVISRYYPLISGEEIVLPPGSTMYLRVKRWWIEVILPNGECLV